MNFQHKDFLAIQLALKNGNIDRLTEVQRRKMIIMDICDDVIRLYGMGREATLMVQQRVKQQIDHEYSIRMCVEYMIQAQILFGSMLIFDKPYWKGMILDRTFKAVRYMETQMFGTTDLQQLHDMLDDAEKLKKLPKVDTRMMSEYLRALNAMTELLELNKPDPPYNPLDEVRTIVITNDKSKAGIEGHRALNEKVRQRLIDMGAKQKEDGSWE